MEEASTLEGFTNRSQMQLIGKPSFDSKTGESHASPGGKPATPLGALLDGGNHVLMNSSRGGGVGGGKERGGRGEKGGKTKEKGLPFLPDSQHFPFQDSVKESLDVALVLSQKRNSKEPFLRNKQKGTFRLDNIISSRAGYVQTICQERKFPELSFTFCLFAFFNQGGKSSSTSFRVSGWLSSPFRTRKINDVSSSSTSAAAAAASSSLSSSSAASSSASPPLEEVEQELAELEAEQRRILGLASSCWPGSGGGRGSGSSPADSPLTELPSAEEQQLLQQQQEPGALQQLMAQEELLKLYILKLEEEANYFKATSPVEEEFCACPKCQVNWTGLASCVWNGFRTPKRPSELMSDREGEGKSWRLGQSERSRDGCRQRRVREEEPLLRDIGRLERRSWWALPTLKNIPLGEKKKVYGGSERPIRISWKGSEEGERRYEGGGAGEGGRRLLSWVVGGCG